MTMSEPLLPHPDAAFDRTPAAEPDPEGPPPAAPEEPDVLAPEGTESGDGTVEPLPALRETPFRTPKPGERLHPDDLADDDEATHTD